MEEMKIKGYKAFNSDLSNRYGALFEVNGTYSVDGEAIFGNNGNGFHFCERLEDTLRYFDAMDGEVQIAEVIGSKDIREYNDEYYGYYDMYSATKLEVVRVLTRTEIINMFSSLPGYRVVRFVQGYRLSDEEKAWFKLRYLDDSDVLKAIAYYQEGDKEAYSPEKAYTYMKRERKRYSDK